MSPDQTLADRYVLRRAEPRDGAQFVALVRALADFEKLPGPDEAAATRLIDHAFALPCAEGEGEGRGAFSPAPRFELLVAESQEDPSRLLAYALYFPTYSTFLARPSLYLEDLFVHPAARGRGIGEALMRRLAATAVERGCGRFEWTVLDWNRRAGDFYVRLGAQVLPEWRICRVDGEALATLAGPLPATR